MTSTWSLLESDFHTVESILLELLDRTQSLAVHLVDRAGQVVLSAGADVDYDLQAFGSLAAADLAANDELIQLVGGARVDGVACLGSFRSMASTMVADRLVLCVVFDQRSSLGLVRHRMRRAGDRLSAIFSYIFERLRAPADASEAIPIAPSSFSSAASSAIDDLLGEDIPGARAPADLPVETLSSEDVLREDPVEDLPSEDHPGRGLTNDGTD